MMRQPSRSTSANSYPRLPQQGSGIAKPRTPWFKGFGTESSEIGQRGLGRISTDPVASPTSRRGFGERDEGCGVRLFPRPSTRVSCIKAMAAAGPLGTVFRGVLPPEQPRATGGRLSPTPAHLRRLVAHTTSASVFPYGLTGSASLLNV